jgi:hypothetical protein
MHRSAVASALTYATHRGVTILLLCSTVESSHWLSNLGTVTDDGSKGVCVISLCYLCQDCSKQGLTGVCAHGLLKLPWHIDTGGELANDPVRQVMELVSPGSYQQEICGYNDLTREQESEVFDVESIRRMVTSNCVFLTNEDIRCTNAVFVCLDPVQAGNFSGIGLAIILQTEEVFTVSISS